jgi:transposase InsO family protein
MVDLQAIRLPELDKNRVIDQHKALVFDGNIRYDLILGADFLAKSGIDIKYSSGTVEWFDSELPMRDPTYLDDDEYIAMAEALEVHREEEQLFGRDWYDPACFAAAILDAKYEKVEVDDVVEQLTHLNQSQKDDLLKVLKQFTKLFDGTLGVYPHRKFHIDIMPGAKPKHVRPYAIARIHLEPFKKELDHLVSIGVLSPQGASEWGSPTFITPKKDGRIRWVSDLRELNKVVIRKVYPLPIIQDILKKRAGYEFFTKIDISMQYYTFELDEESKDLTTIVTPFGKYRYNVLPMGLKCSPDFAQETMENIFRDVLDAEVYIDDIGAFSNSWEHHLKLLHTILTKLQENGFTVNPLKCDWAVKETDWLGYWLTPTGLRPWKKKITAILNMEAPSNLKQLRGFVGMVNFYRDMWPHRAHILAPLTAKTGAPKKGAKQPKFVWTEDMEKAFKQMKAMMASDVLCAYPNHNKPFDIFTDASDYQLGACVMQDGQPVAYYSKKLNSAQRNYATMDKELLSIVMTLKEFRSMLLGAVINIHTDHKNILTLGDSSQRRLRWISYVDEYGPTLHYIKGPNNVIADTFSRMPMKTTAPLIMVGKEEPTADPLECHFSVTDDVELMKCLAYLPDEECYLNLPADSAVDNPLDMETIKEQQDADNDLQRQATKYADRYVRKSVSSIDNVLCYVKPGDPPANWKIALPKSMLQPTIRWFHQVTGHPGSKRLHMQISSRYYHRDLRRLIDSYKCDHCQRHKLDGKGYGHLPEREIRSMPFEECAVDLIGPWKVQVRTKPYKFSALTIIDTVSNLVELVRIDEKTSAHIAKKFAQVWLTRYPWPARCIHDNGGEFIGPEFQLLLEGCRIKDVPTTSKNPQANSICERMHQTVGNVLRTLLHGQPPQQITGARAKEFIDEALSITMHAVRAGMHSTLGSSPGSLVFNRDMFLNIPLIADWHAVTKRREHLVNENLMRENRKRRRHDYAIDNRVLKKRHNPTRLGLRTIGPFKVVQTHVNGTVTIELRPGVTERINIRRIIPYNE